MRPNAYIIVIGPSDMSHKVGEKYETYAFLDLVNGELKKAAFKAGLTPKELCDKLFKTHKKIYLVQKTCFLFYISQKTRKTVYGKTVKP